MNQYVSGLYMTGRQKQNATGKSLGSEDYGEYSPLGVILHLNNIKGGTHSLRGLLFTLSIFDKL